MYVQCVYVNVCEYVKGDVCPFGVNREVNASH